MKTIQEIYESIILEAMSLEDIWEKYYNKDLNLETFKAFNKIDPTSSDNKKGKYLDWIIRKAQVQNPGLLEDSSKIKEDLELFDKNYKHINKQITQIKDQYELAKLVQDFRKKKESGEIDLSRSEIKKDTEKILEDSTWLILHPKTEESAKYYGANTRWCTAAEKDNRFDTYNKQGPLYILINKKDNQKFQFHFQDEQYMDEEDNPIQSKYYETFPEYILDKLVELANINKNIIAFILQMSEKLQEKYLKIHAKEYSEYIITKELIKYSRLGNLQKVKEAITNGADIHAENDRALRSAVRNDYINIVKFLVENGADIHAENDRVLRYAVESENFPIVKFLVENGADIHAQDDFALRLATLKGHFEVVKFLVENRANIHADNDWALRVASTYGHFEAVKFLVENGANIHAENDYALRNAKTQEIKKYLQSIINKEKK